MKKVNERQVEWVLQALRAFISIRKLKFMRSKQAAKELFHFINFVLPLAAAQQPLLLLQQFACRIHYFTALQHSFREIISLASNACSKQLIMKWKREWMQPALPATHNPNSACGMQRALCLHFTPLHFIYKFTPCGACKFHFVRFTHSVKFISLMHSVNLNIITVLDFTQINQTVNP